MNKFYFIIIAAFGLFFQIGHAQDQAKLKFSRRPNIIIVLADDVGYGDLGCNGNPIVKTPNIDQLHDTSIRFTDFHVAPMCTPTRAELLTGTHCIVNRANNVSSGRAIMRADIPTLAEILKKNGYNTGMFGKWHLGSTYPYRPQDRGFEETLWFPSSHIGSIPDAWNNDYFNDQYSHNGKLTQYQGYCTDVFFKQAMAWMDKEAKKPKPFFAYLPLNAAHAPYFVDSTYRKKYLGKIPERVKKKSVRYSIAGFLGMIDNLDENMGKLKFFLKEMRLEENTIFVFLTDNGTANGEKVFNAGMKGKKRSLYEGGHRVPLFIKWPEGKLGQPRDITDNTQVQDVFTTLLDLAEVKVPKEDNGIEGKSLKLLLRDSDEKLIDRMSIIQYSPFIWYVDPNHSTAPQKYDAAVMWNTWRLVDGKELYQIAKDPGQKNNVAREYPEVKKKMRDYYEKWWKKSYPGSEGFLPVYIGAPQENPVLLTACDWADTFMDKGTDVRKGMPRNGAWHIKIAREGKYRFELRRWPKPLEVGLSQSVPVHNGEDGNYDKGVALPIAKARIRIQGYDKEIRIDTTESQATFEFNLIKGNTKLQTWFYNISDKELCGAYYVYVTYIP